MLVDSTYVQSILGIIWAVVLTNTISIVLHPQFIPSFGSDYLIVESRKQESIYSNGLSISRFSYCPNPFFVSHSQINKQFFL